MKYLIMLQAQLWRQDLYIHKGGQWETNDFDQGFYDPQSAVEQFPYQTVI